MDAFLTSTLVVALAEIGDKTMLLAILLAARFEKPVPIILGILVATVANHALAALLGHSVAGIFEGRAFRIAVGLGFIAMALWTLVPDTIDEEETKAPSRFSPFLATTIAFFLVEIGDKTQVATVALAAQYRDVVAVTLGTTTGMMLANVPAVFFGKAIVERVSLGLVRSVAAALFLVIGLWVLGEAVGAV